MRMDCWATFDGWDFVVDLSFAVDAIGCMRD